MNSQCLQLAISSANTNSRREIRGIGIPFSNHLKPGRHQSLMMLGLGGQREMKTAIQLTETHTPGCAQRGTCDSGGTGERTVCPASPAEREMGWALSQPVALLATPPDPLAGCGGSHHRQCSPPQWTRL